MILVLLVLIAFLPHINKLCGLRVVLWVPVLLMPGYSTMVLVLEALWFLMEFVWQSVEFILLIVKLLLIDLMVLRLILISMDYLLLQILKVETLLLFMM